MTLITNDIDSENEISTKPNITPTSIFPLDVSSAIIEVMFLVTWSIDPPTIAAAPYLSLIHI